MAHYPNTQKTNRRPSVAMRRQSKKRFAIGIFFAFLAGYVLAWFYSPVVFTTAFQTFLGGGKTHAVNDLPAKTASLPKPKFEFYTLLTQEKAVTEKAPLKSKPPAVAAPMTPSHQAVQEAIKAPEPVKAVSAEPLTAAEPSKYIYLLQLASFQRQEDAEQMKASLIMRGFDVNIKTATQQGGVWHRVVIGPFGSRQKAEKTQADIARSERISGIIRRVDV
ncbi:MAG: SPOR domain-containing protein [Legionellaceae bacterium]|nr:SPOR domain-containing protein [Legionellaceae bacterium]